MNTSGDVSPQPDAQGVYAGPSSNVSAPQAVRRLVGYEKVTLRPGRAKRVTISVDRHQLEHWQTGSQSWQLGAGRRPFAVGGSSVELPLRTTANVA